MTLLGEDGLSKDSVDEDKCRLMKDSVLQGFKDFCTSRGGCLDEALFGHVKQVIVAWASDRCPAVMKAARMLREDCPNLEFVYKDPCHVLRTVAGLVQTAFERSEAVLFEDKGSVIPSVMNSHEWQDKFVWLQKLVLDKDHGRFAGALKVAVRHFDFVRPRWESTACPRRRMAHLVVPTALVLAVTAADQRTDSATKRRRKGYPFGSLCVWCLLVGQALDFAGLASARTFPGAGLVCGLGRGIHQGHPDFGAGVLRPCKPGRGYQDLVSWRSSGWLFGL